MKRWILRIHDRLAAHPLWAWLGLAVILILSLLGAWRMDYEEDIAAFLPRDAEAQRYAEIFERLGGQDRLAVFFQSDTAETDRIMDAMDAFGTHWAEADTASLVSDMQICIEEADLLEDFDVMAAHYPFFLREEDYVRMDSLLARPSWIPEKIAEDRRALSGVGSSLSARYIQSDPLGLFTPVLERLRTLNPTRGQHVEDGYLFTEDGRCGVVFFSSPFGGSESARNGEVVSLLSAVKAQVAAEYPDLRICSTGGPEVAVENASRIRKDSLLAVSLALVLIVLVLYLSFKRFSDVLWIALSILVGALFALGLISLVKSSVSIIILGIGSMIIGIAVNYPLHYVDHLKFTRDRRKALSDQVNPLLVGNITTVGAFLSLMLLKADALRDFGFIGAMMLVGTIFFVLILLPILVKEAQAPRTTLRLDWDRHIHLGRRGRGLLFVAFLLLSGFLALHSRHVGFDADMHHINYMTSEQREGFALLEDLGESEEGMSRLFVVAQAPDRESALRLNEKVQTVLESSGFPYSSLADFLPSAACLQARMERWDAFRQAHPDLPRRLMEAATAEGFSEAAFDPFLLNWYSEGSAQAPDVFARIAGRLGRSMFLPREDKQSLVSYVQLPLEQRDEQKAALRAALPDDAFCFGSEDVSHRLVDLMNVDFDRIGFLCSLIVFLFLSLSFRSLELSTLTFLPLAVGWVWILGAMQLGGIQFNIVNIILASFIFGQGDDYSIFMTEGLMYEYATGKKILASYKNCVVLSALVMFIGIGSLITARHPAMRSLASVTMIGMFTVVLMAYYLPPLLFRFLTQRRGRERVEPLRFWALLKTGLVLLIALLALLLLHPIGLLLKEDRFHRLVQWVARTAIRRIPGCPYRCENPLGEDFSRPALLVSNHQSHLDVLAVLALHPKIVMLTADWVWHNPVYGLLIRKAGFIPASRGYAANLPLLREKVAQGYSIAVFPEGTRSADGQIQRFHRGAFLMAAELELDLLPLTLHGFAQALPKAQLQLSAYPLSLHIGARQDASAALTDPAAFTRSFRAQYMRAFDQIRRNCEDAAFVGRSVRAAYRYKGLDAAAECRRTLRADTYARVDAETAERVIISGAGYGVFALLLALTHPEIEVTAYEEDEDKYLTASRIRIVPANLHYVCARFGGAVDADQKVYVL